jgi:hypothetical protein
MATMQKTNGTPVEGQRVVGFKVGCQYAMFPVLIPKSAVKDAYKLKDKVAQWAGSKAATLEPEDNEVWAMLLL